MQARPSRLKMRSRPIDTTKKLPLIPTDIEVDEEADEFLLYHQPNAQPTSIPIPPNQVNDSYDRSFHYDRWIPPVHYIKFHLTTPSLLYSDSDRYDLTAEDCEWASNWNSRHGYSASGSSNSNANNHASDQGKLTEDDMARLMDEFEKEAGKITLLHGDLMTSEEKIDVSREFTLVKAILLAVQRCNIRNNTAVEDIYTYWIEKRKKLGKALIPIFQEPPPKGNTDPHVAFRPRTEGRRISRRNPRKDDLGSYQKMNVLKRDWQRLNEIVESMIEREKMKLQRCLLDVQIFDERLAQSYHGSRLLSQAASLPATTQPPFPHLPALFPFTLLRSPLPPCTFQKSNDSKKKRKSFLPSSSKASALMPPPPVPSAGSSSFSSSRSFKKDFKKGFPKKYSDLGSASSSAASASSTTPNLLLDERDMDWSEESDDLMSEDDELQSYYTQVEEYLNRSRMPPEQILPTLASIDTAFPLSEDLPSYESIRAPPGVTVHGRMRPRIGRQALMWLDTTLYEAGAIKSEWVNSTVDPQSQSPEP